MQVFVPRSGHPILSSQLAATVRTIKAIYAHLISGCRSMKGGSEHQSVAQGHGSDKCDDIVRRSGPVALEQPQRPCRQRGIAFIYHDIDHLYPTRSPTHRSTIVTYAPPAPPVTTSPFPSLHLHFRSLPSSSLYTSPNSLFPHPHTAPSQSH